MTLDTRPVILFLHPTPDRYGADVALLELVRGLDPERWRAVVALPYDGPLVARLRSAGAAVEFGPLGVIERRTLRSPLRLLKWLAELPRAVRFVRDLVALHRPALVHTNTSVVLGGAIGAKLAGARHLWHIHEIIGRPAAIERRFARLAAQLADVVVSNSHATRAALDRHSSELAARHRVVHNGLDAADRERLMVGRWTRATARRELSIADDAPVVVLVGRINGWKGQGLFMEAAERLRLRLPDAQFLIVGDAPPGQQAAVVNLRKEIEARNLTGYVRYMPHTDAVGCLYSAADVVAVPSTRPEPFGLVALEAMMFSRPVVAAAHGGVTEVVEPGVTGLLFEPGDPEKLARALQVILEEPVRAREMGRRGALRQAELFTRERTAAAFDHIWCQLVERSFELPASEATIAHFVLGRANPERLNGVNHVVHHLAAAQAARGLDVRVFGLVEDTSSDSGERPYPLHVLPRGKGQFRLSRELLAALDALPSTTVAHLHGGFLPTMSALGRALRKRRIPYVLTPHGSYQRLARAKSGIRKRIYTLLFERRLLRGARMVQAFSARERDEMTDLVPARKVAVVPNGQDVLQDVAPLDPANVRRPLFGYLGRFDAHTKGLDALVDAFARHVAVGGEGTLWLVGEGADRAALEKRAAELGVHRRITFHEPRFGAEKAATLQTFDVFVHPSRHEGMPTAVLEAAAMGRPVIITAGTCLGREVREYGAGFALDRPDTEALAAALAACEREWQARTLHERGAGARAMIGALFSWSKIEPELCRALYRLDDPTPDQLPDLQAAPAVLDPNERRRSA